MDQKLADPSNSRLLVAAAILSMVIMPSWIPFDYLIDPLNFNTFLVLRIVYVFVILFGLVAFIRAGMQPQHYRRFALLLYLYTILTILPMCIMTDAKYPYYIGFSTVFFAASVLLVWPLRFFLIPLILSALAVSIWEWKSETDLIVHTTSLFLMINVIAMAGVASWQTYKGFLTRQALMEQLHELSNTDPLTKLHNRRYFDLMLKNELDHAARNDTSTAVMMLDVDHFKRYNDYYGHQQGDECLCRVADCLRQSISRKTDFVARYGGEEFVIVLPDTDVVGAEDVARTIIESLDELRIPHSQSPVVPFVTVSIGIACRKPMSADEIVALADAALYKAKQSGRNRFVVG